MNDLRLFGSREHPLRCSQLPLMMRCSWRSVMLFAEMMQDTSREAADTGSAVHKAVDAWHKNGQDYRGALTAMKEGLGKYPLADLGDAELHFRPYTQDPRNVSAAFAANEGQVEFEIGDGVWVRGTMDQVREDGGRLYVWDLKTGSPEGWDMVLFALYQVCAYAVGASAELGRDVQPGGIIRTRGYRKRGVDARSSPPGVFWHVPFDLAGARRLLDAVRLQALRIREGDIAIGPGDWCRYCPARGIDACVPKLIQLTVKEAA